MAPKYNLGTKDTQKKHFFQQNIKTSGIYFKEDRKHSIWAVSGSKL